MLVFALLISQTLTGQGSSLEQRLADIAQRTGFRPVTRKVKANPSKLAYVAGRDIAPECPNIAVELHAAALDCFMMTWSDQISDTGRTQLGLQFQFESSARGQDGIQVRRYRQTVQGVPILGTEQILTVRNGRIISWTGELVDQLSSAFIGPPHVSPALASIRDEKDRYYDRDLGRYVLEAFDPLEFSRVNRFDLADGSLIDFYLAESASNLQQHQTVVAMMDVAGGFRPSQPPAIQTVDLLFDDTGSDLCLDHGSDLEDGEPKVVHSLNSDDGPTRCRAKPAPPSAVFLGYPTLRDGRLSNFYFWGHDLAVFANSTNANYDKWYSWDQFNAENLKMVYQTNNYQCGNATLGGCLQSGASEYRIVMPEDSSGRDDLFTLAHEYGHFVHHMYDFQGGINAPIERRSIAEGFADHNVLRYALFRMVNKSSRPHDSSFPIPNTNSSYFLTSNRARAYVVEQQFSNGEAVPTGRYNALTDMIYTPWDTDDACHSTAFNPYKCGKLISAIYWTLAWNKIRVGYQGQAAEADIIDSSTGWLSAAVPPNTDPTAERLVNIAFTYAILGLPGNPDLGSFFDRVSERFFLFLIDGSITPDEYFRVEAVLGSHCLGWGSSDCTKLHRTAWQDLPVAQTMWATFNNTSSNTVREEFFRAEDATHVGLILNKSHGTPDGLGYEVMADQSAEICKRLTFLDDGTYKVHIAARADPSISGDVEVTIYAVGDAPSWLPWTLDPLDGSWSWYHDSPHFQEVEEGDNWVCLRSADELDVDALLVRNVP